METLEIIQWVNGEDIVKYRRDYPSNDATMLMQEVDEMRHKLGEKCEYDYRIV